MNENVVNSNHYSNLIVYTKCAKLIMLNPPALYAFGIIICQLCRHNHMPAVPAYDMAPLRGAICFLVLAWQSVI